MKPSKHNPMILILFIAGLAGETIASSIAGEHIVFNGAVVLATALYFYTMDDIAKLITKLTKKG